MEMTVLEVQKLRGQLEGKISELVKEFDDLVDGIHIIGLDLKTNVYSVSRGCLKTVEVQVAMKRANPISTYALSYEGTNHD